MRHVCHSLLCLITCLGCRTTGGDAGSRVLHDADQPVADKNNWVELSRDEYLSDLKENLYKLNPQTLLPDDHPLTARAQYWIDLIDHTLRQKYPDKLDGVPHPLAGVIASPEDNAYSSSALVCKAVATRLDPASKATRPDIGFIGLIAEGGSGVVGEVAAGSCVERPLTPADFADVLKDASNDPCDFVLSADSTAQQPIIQINLPCPALSAKLAGKAVAKGIAGRQVANRITFYSHIFSIIKDEREFVAITAHELGHYYRAHGVSESVPYDFFYKVADNSPGRRPVADPSVADFGAKVLAASKRTEWSSGAMIDGAGWSVALSGDFFHLGLLISNGEQCAGHVTCQADCAKVRAFNWQSAAPGPGISRVAFENAFMSCADHIAFAPAVGVSALTLEPVATLADKLKDLTNLDQQVQNIAAQSPTWGGVLRGLNELLRAQAKPDLALLSNAATQGLGYYTIEQEADELSAEWLAMIGIDPAFATRSYLDVSIAEGANNPLGVTNVAFSLPDQATCRTLYDHGWKDASGQSVFIPLGDYGEPHHNTCYRAWNIDREIRGHKYTIAAPPAFPVGPWSDIVAAALAVSK